MAENSQLYGEQLLDLEISYPEVNLEMEDDEEDGSSKRFAEKSGQISDFRFATALRRFGSVLIQKSQTPQMKKLKAGAIKEMAMHFLLETGVELTEKQIMKKVNNMKSRIKSKTDKKATGNRQICLNSGEKIFYDLLGAEENPAVSKVNYGVSVGSSAIALKRQSIGIISDDDEDILQSPVKAALNDSGTSNVLTESGQIAAGKSLPLQEKFIPPPSKVGRFTGKARIQPSEHRLDPDKLSNSQLQQKVLVKQFEVLEQQQRINDKLESVLDKAGDLLNRYLK
ncbi:uncharacterized protein LOC134218164 [Armigeres subalbatus]|uniref:uncharacterized protein LOC134218164 n=1 Tax=Armigeres subalbatus TaxID=124917 RepID=UPI002ED28128